MSIQAREYVIGTKAIPKLLYGNLVTMYPIQSMRKLRTRVLEITWGAHRKLRCPGLVIILINKGHITDPIMADYYRNYMEVHRLLNKNAQRKLTLNYAASARNKQSHKRKYVS